MTEPTEPVGGGSDGAMIRAARALTGPATVDHTARTVDVVWSTGARARNFVPPLGWITEELDMSPSAVRMGKLLAGAPVLNTHRGHDARDVAGRVLDAKIEGGLGSATLQFSSATDVEPIWQRIADGTLRSVSVGYLVHRYSQVQDSEGGTVHRAVDWEPYEISIVAIPVDSAAVIRGEANRLAPVPAVEPPLPTQPPSSQELSMSEVNQAPDPSPEPVSAPAGGNRSVTPQPADGGVDPVRAERARVAAITEAANAARAMLPGSVVDEIFQQAVADGLTVEGVRALLWGQMLAYKPKPSIPAAPVSSTLSMDDPAVLREAMADAIAVRAMPGYQAKDGGRHSEFVGWRPSDMIGELMRARGERNIPRDTAKLAERAFHTSSDFPLLLSASANKMLLAAYQPAQPTYRQVFLRRDFRDFKPHRHLRVGDFPNLLAVAESGEVQAGTISESQELVSLLTFARRIRVTRQMLVNDDLGAFTDFASMIGRRVADFENATAYALVNTASGSGPTLTTGNAAVFSTAAGRANQAATGTAIDLANLAAGRAAIMKQKTLDGLPISVGGSMRLLVGPNQELVARQLTVSVAASQVSNANIYAGFIQPVVEPQIPSNRWYLYAAPEAAPVYVYGFLNGAEGPQVSTGPVSGVDGVEISVIHDFGVGAIDFRGGWFNPGT